MHQMAKAVITRSVRCKFKKETIIIRFFPPIFLSRLGKNHCKELVHTIDFVDATIPNNPEMRYKSTDNFYLCRRFMTLFPRDGGRAATHQYLVVYSYATRGTAPLGSRRLET